MTRAFTPNPPVFVAGDDPVEQAVVYRAAADTFADRVILITGAADGIGREVALAAAAAGATTVLLDKEVKRVSKVYDKIVENGYPEPAIYPLNLEGATAHDYQEMAATLEREFGRLDALVWNAGWAGTLTPARLCDPEVWVRVVNANLTGPFFLAQSVLGLLEAAPEGCIVVSEHDARKAYWGPFAAAKAGVAALVDVLAAEYTAAYRLIRVNGIDTGPLATRMRAYHYPAENPAQHPSPAAAAAAYLYCLSAASAPLSGAHLRLEGALPRAVSDSPTSPLNAQDAPGPR